MSIALSSVEALSLFAPIRFTLAAAPAGNSNIIGRIEAIVLPILRRFGRYINMAALESTIVEALAAGGGLQGVLAAILANLPSIVTPGAPDGTHQAIAMHLEMAGFHGEAAPV